MASPSLSMIANPRAGVRRCQAGAESSVGSGAGPGARVGEQQGRTVFSKNCIGLRSRAGPGEDGSVGQGLRDGERGLR